MQLIAIAVAIGRGRLDGYISNSEHDSVVKTLNLGRAERER